MTDIRQAAQQALEALQYASTGNRSPKIIGPAISALHTALEQQQAEPVSMRIPKVGDKVICLEDESLGEVVSLTAGGSPDIKFDDGTRGTYMLREFAELFGYVAAQLDKTSFNVWWDSDYDDSENPFEQDSAAYWAWAGWQAAKRPWVGLTDEEIEAVVEQVANGKLVGTVQEFRIRFSRAIEAKLKERNT